MKKSLMVIAAFVLIFTHIIPPLNISFANEEVNECENMGFSVQTIKENDEKIVGAGMASDQLTVEFKTKNKTETVNVDVNGKFELKVDEEFLGINDVILISNDYFKVETKVVSEEGLSNLLQSKQYVECPVVEETTYSEDAVSEETDTEEASYAEDIAPEEPDAEESSDAEDIVPEEPDAEEATDTEDIVSEEPDAEEATDAEDIAPEEPGTENLSDSEDLVPEEPDTEKPSDSEDTVPENEVTEVSDTEETSNLEDMRQEVDAEKTPDSENMPTEKLDEMRSEDLLENNILSNLLMIEPYQTGGLINVDLLNSAELEASHNLRDDGIHEITLSYIGYSSLQLGLLNNVYTNFYLPKEIIEVISNEDLSASYSVPALGLLGIIINTKGTFDNNDIQIRGNHVSMEFSNLLSLNLSLLKPAEYEFTLKIELESLPPTIDGKYNFYSTTSDALIDVSLIPGGNIKTDTIDNMPKLPEGTVTFHNVPPSITFNAESMDYTKGSIIIARQNSDWSIDVLDTRTEGSKYSISAKAETPLTNTETQHILPNALIYVDSEGESKPLYSSNSDSTVQVHDGVTESEEIIKNKWDADEGVLLEVNPYNVQPGTYETTINWTLTDGPQ